jgi:hypothetical protein
MQIYTENTLLIRVLSQSEYVAAGRLLPPVLEPSTDRNVLVHVKRFFRQQFCFEVCCRITVGKGDCVAPGPTVLACISPVLPVKEIFTSRDPRPF